MPHYKRWWRNGDPTAGAAPRGTAKEIRAHLEYLAALQTDECVTDWPFQRGADDERPKYGGVAAARAVLALAKGEPARRDMQACHECREPRCLNPRHLRWDTVLGNQRDRRRDGTDPSGERNPRARLSAEQAAAIRTDRSRPAHLIALDYGVSVGTVNRIRQGRGWVNN